MVLNKLVQFLQEMKCHQANPVVVKEFVVEVQTLAEELQLVMTPVLLQHLLCGLRCGYASNSLLGCFQ
jgi:hypothetical protein